MDNDFSCVVENIKLYLFFVTKPFKKVLVGVYSSIAQEWPPAVYLFGTLHIECKFEILLLVNGGLNKDFALWSADKTATPELNAVCLPGGVELKSLRGLQQ